MRLKFLEAWEIIPQNPPWHTSHVLTLFHHYGLLASLRGRIVGYMVFWSQLSKLSLDKPCSPCPCLAVIQLVFLFVCFKFVSSTGQMDLYRGEGWSPQLRAHWASSRHYALFGTPERRYNDKLEGLQESTGLVGLELCPTRRSLFSLEQRWLWGTWQHPGSACWEEQRHWA